MHARKRRSDRREAKKASQSTKGEKEQPDNKADVEEAVKKKKPKHDKRVLRARPVESNTQFESQDSVKNVSLRGDEENKIVAINQNLRSSKVEINSWLPRLNGDNCKLVTNLRAVMPIAPRSRNIIHQLSQTIQGMKCSFHSSASVVEPVVTMTRSLRLERKLMPFDRRCTALEWHPSRHGYLTVASKGGDIILWNTNTSEHEVFIKGGGAGGSTQAVHFMPGEDNKILTASIDGTVRVHDLQTKQNTILLDTMNCIRDWYSSVDIQKNTPRPTIAAGRNNGQLSIIHQDGTQILTPKLHKGKITHVEFNAFAPWMLCTGSLDKACKIWDLRMIKDRNSFLFCLEHNKGLNSAYFSPRDGSQLLTTDQNDEIRVYSGPMWQLNTKISHPHRFFRHMTPIKACWHTLVDMIAVARYPTSGSNDIRSVDLYCARSGALRCQLTDPSASGLMSLNQFSPLGDRLVSTMGSSILIWARDEEDCAEKTISNLSDQNVQGKKSRQGPKSTTSTASKKKQSKNKAQEKAAKEKLAKLYKDDYT